jgi:hypothetical protein
MWIKNGIYLNKWIITLIIISLIFYFYLKKIEYYISIIINDIYVINDICVINIK